jgi:hypothetical protein
MPDAIPKDEAYQRRFLGPLNVKQSIYAAIACALILFLWMLSGVESMTVKIAATLVIFFATVWIISSGLDATSI